MLDASGSLLAFIPFAFTSNPIALSINQLIKCLQHLGDDDSNDIGDDGSNNISDDDRNNIGDDDNNNIGDHDRNNIDDDDSIYYCK